MTEEPEKNAGAGTGEPRVEEAPAPEGAETVKAEEAEEVYAEEKGYEFLMPRSELLSAGLHIGTKIKMKDMKPYIRTVRPDGLSLLNLRTIDERIRVAGAFLSRFTPQGIVAVSGKEYGRVPVQKFCEYVGAVPVVGRFPPGMFSNPLFSGHVNAEAVLISDPKVDYKAAVEASIVGAPVVAVCDTDNMCGYIDLVVPGNNKGRRALAVTFRLLAGEILRRRGVIPPDGDIAEPVTAFESPPTAEEE